MDKEKYIATSAVVALGTDTTQIPYYISSGFLSEQYYNLIPFLFVIAFLGSYVSREIITRTEQGNSNDGLESHNSCKYQIYTRWYYGNFEAREFLNELQIFRFFIVKNKILIS